MSDRRSAAPLAVYLSRRVWYSILPLILLAGGLAGVVISRLAAEREQTAANLARNFATAVDQHLEARIGALRMLALSLLVDDPRRWPELYHEAEAYHKSFGTHVIFASARDAQPMRFNTRVPFGTALPALPRPRGRAAAPEAIATGRPAIGDIFFGPVAREPLVAIAVPVLRDGRVTGLFLTTLELQSFQQRVDAVVLPEGWALSLLDGTGSLIARGGPVVPQAKGSVAKSGVAAWSVVVGHPRAWARGALLPVLGLVTATLLAAVAISIRVGRDTGRRLGRALHGLAGPGTPSGASSGILEIDAVRQLLDEAAARRASAEEELRRSEERFRRLFEEAPLPLAYVDGNGIMVALNARFTRTFGYSRAELRTLEDWWRLAYPDPGYRDKVRQGWTAAVRRAVETGGEIETRQVRVTGKDEAVRPVLVSAILVAEGVLAAFVDQTESHRAELELRAAQASALEEQQRARLAALNQMEDANAARATAEAAEQEVRQLNAELERRVLERTAALTAANQELDSFAYAVSHDLRAPLRTMCGFSHVLLEDVGDILASEAKGNLDRIIGAGQHMNEIIDGLLALSRSTRGELRRNVVDVSALAAQLLVELGQGEPERRVSTEIAAGLRLLGDERMVAALLRNLLSNAWKYTGKTPAPSIRVSGSEREGRRWVCVADNGAGFDMACVDKLFQPFQRLHRESEFPGIGIGLATVQRIVHRHGGLIEACGEPDKGATFCVTLMTE